MSIITEFTVPAESFALERTFDVVSDVSIEIERLATHSREWVMPFLVATGEDVEALEPALREDPSVEKVRTIDLNSEIGYFNVHWAEVVEQLVDRIVDQHGIMQEAEAIDGTWYLKLKFVDHDALEAFQSHFRERGYSFDLQRLHDGPVPKEREYDLTSEQREALVAALEMGYFAVPRDAPISDLAEELGVSTNAVSQRLRRATGNLTSNVLTVSPPDSLSDAQ